MAKKIHKQLKYGIYKMLVKMSIVASQKLNGVPIPVEPV